jgi:hypothetical protein
VGFAELGHVSACAKRGTRTYLVRKGPEIAVAAGHADVSVVREGGANEELLGGARTCGGARRGGIPRAPET